MSKRNWLNKDIATDYFSITNAGFYYLEINEQHGEWLYPTVNDRNPAGWFTYDPSNMVVGDFNADGYQDVAFIWTVLPHVIERSSSSFPTIFINDGQGGLSSANTIVDGSIPTRHMLYRTATADFNRDGRDDLIMTSAGMIKRDPTQPNGFKSVYEPIAYLMSGVDGKLRDASHLIEGQENGGLPEGFSFGHDLSVGDFDGDGYQDIYTGKVLLLNNGDGSFRNATALLPEELKKIDSFVMSSTAGDLNGDGIDDIIVSYSDPELRYALLSSDKGIIGGTLIQLPASTYGSNNTKSNFINTADLDGDGLIDIVIAETRSEPYYVGQHLQIIMNKGNGIFVDQTASRINNRPFDQHSGEGEIFLVDVNFDGHVDIVHSTGETYRDGEFRAGGLDIFMNRGQGQFIHVPTAYFPAIDNLDINGYENTYARAPLMRALPLNLDSKHGLDFVSFKQLPFTAWPQVEPNAFFTFTMTAKEIINRLPIGLNYVALDTDGVAGQAYRIYKAAFDRAPDLAGLGFWINAMDKGAALTGVAGGFIGSEEFQSRYGQAVDMDFIKLLYENVLDRQPDAAGYQFWQDAMARGLTREGVLIEFSESGENKANVAGLIANGIEYTPFIS